MFHFIEIITMEELERLIKDTMYRVERFDRKIEKSCIMNSRKDGWDIHGG